MKNAVLPRHIAATLSSQDRELGNYWELPNGEPQNRCPRVAIRENPDWWYSIVLAYGAYERGFLPVAGGLDDQPALFLPIMAVISSALDDERKLREEQQDRSASIVSKHRAANEGGKVSVLNNPSSGYAKISTPGR